MTNITGTAASTTQPSSQKSSGTAPDAAAGISTDDYELMTEFRLRVFKLYGLLLQESENTLAGSKLTRSRNLLLGVLERAGQPMTASQIAHEMGQTRQGVSRLVALLAADGYLALTDNPYHRSSKLVSLTAAGKIAHDRALQLHVDLTQTNPFPVSSAELRTTCEVMAAVIASMESGQSAY